MNTVPPKSIVHCQTATLIWHAWLLIQHNLPRHQCSTVLYFASSLTLLNSWLKTLEGRLFPSIKQANIHNISNSHVVWKKYKLCWKCLRIPQQAFNIYREFKSFPFLERLIVSRDLIWLHNLQWNTSKYRIL